MYVKWILKLACNQRRLFTDKVEKILETKKGLLDNFDMFRISFTFIFSPT